MIKLISDSFFSYLRETSIQKMFLQAIILIITTFSLVFGIIIVQNFDYISQKLTADKKNSAEQLKKSIERNLKIDFELQRSLIDNPYVQRVFVRKFHDGVEGIDGVKFVYESTTHESVSSGVSPSAIYMNLIPLSINPAALGFLENQCQSINVKEETISAYTSLLKFHNVSFSVVCPLYLSRINGYKLTKPGILIGYVGFDYLFGKEPRQSENSIFTYLTKLAERISNIYEN